MDVASAQKAKSKMKLSKSERALKKAKEVLASRITARPLPGEDDM